MLPPRTQLLAERVHADARPMPVAPHRQVFIPLPSLDAAHGAVHVTRYFFPSVQLLGGSIHCSTSGLINVIGSGKASLSLLCRNTRSCTSSVVPVRRSVPLVFSCATSTLFSSIFFCSHAASKNAIRSVSFESSIRAMECARNRCIW